MRSGFSARADWREIATAFGLAPAVVTVMLGAKWIAGLQPCTATIVGMIPFGTKIELHGADFLRERRIQGSSMGSNPFSYRHASPH
jgi:hypothetical protein